MKKILFFMGVIITFLLISCKKDNPPQPPPRPIDSFLLHPPPVLDSLPIPLTIGTWWKYQRIDSTINFGNPILGPDHKYFDSSIEIIKVIGKAPYVLSEEGYNGYITRWRYDTVETFLLEVNNLTKGTFDTINAFYYSSFFIVKPHRDTFNLYVKVPILEGPQQNKIPNTSYLGNANVLKNTSVSVLNKNFDNCIFVVDSTSSGGSFSIYHQIKTYIKPGVGFVYWEYYDLWASHYGFGDKRWYYRRLIDYHIAP